MPINAKDNPCDGGIEVRRQGAFGRVASDPSAALVGHCVMCCGLLTRTAATHAAMAALRHALG